MIGRYLGDEFTSMVSYFYLTVANKSDGSILTLLVTQPMRLGPKSPYTNKKTAHPAQVGRDGIPSFFCYSKPL